MKTEQDASPLLGVGLYSVSEAARIASLATGRPVSRQAIDRWLWGYGYRSPSGTSRAAPLWEPDLPKLDGKKVLTFRDLTEVLFVAAFRHQGVSLQTIRRIIGQATELMEDTHPLSSLSFKTDGRRIVADVVDESERRLVFDLDDGQYLLEIVFDRLRDGLDYSEHHATRWWPLGKEKGVVLDPKRRFGAAIVTAEGVPTAVLANAFKAEGSIAAVRHWYGVSESSVREAIEYEDQLRLAA